MYTVNSTLYSYCIFSRYKKSCRLPAASLWDMSTEFFDLYVPFTMNEDLEQQLERAMMYSVFNLISNTERTRRESVSGRLTTVLLLTLVI